MEQTRPAAPVRRGRVPRQRTAPGVGAPPVVPPGRRLRLALVLAAGITALLCLGGVGVAFVFYTSVTTPDRGTPESAVRGYLVAYLSARDDLQADGFTCADPDLSAVQRLREQIGASEERGSAVIVRVQSVALVSESESSAVVSATVRQTATLNGRMFATTADWRFRVVDQGGWRVCGAEQTS
ncbi:hypothetical protein [Micromonospora sp. Llam0]|uniref:Rv0361 family membrane protein n=1 Tax=Micromonospora sp. Llam0 TaxID=2485143 RepID=UPI000F48BA31|nr:hypothetical protein [Micromonospora sp. Llam0]